MKGFRLVVALSTLWLCAPAGASHAVVLLYHHVSADTPPSTSVTPERFEQHLDYLADHDFEVWALDRLLDAVLDQAETVPERVVAITFDDAYESVYREAWPRLAERNWPFTVFVNTDAIDQESRPYQSWDQLRELAAAGVVIANHSASHAHLLHRGDDEEMDQWRARVRADLVRARDRIESEIGQTSGFFAYPYGEESAELRAIVSELGYRALTQRSGAVGPRTHPQAIPRFALATGFDDLDRLARAVNSRPLPVTAAETRPARTLGFVQNPETVHLTLDIGDYRLDALNCFSGAGERLALDVEERDAVAVRIPVAGRGRPGRNRVNCTAPATDGSGAFYWYAFQWLQKHPDGRWPRS